MSFKTLTKAQKHAIKRMIEEDEVLPRRIVITMNWSEKEGQHFFLMAVKASNTYFPRLPPWLEFMCVLP